MNGAQEITGSCSFPAFGFDKDKYEVSVKVAERVLLPAVKSVDLETLVIADGFSCREQIRDLTGRKALHLAEVMWMALHRHSGRSPG